MAVSEQDMPGSLRWFYRRLDDVKTDRKYRQLVKRFMVRAHREGATMLEDDQVPTFEWPDGTRASLHTRIPRDADTPVLYAQGTGPAFEPGGEVHCCRCDKPFEQGSDDSRTHVARYDSCDNRVVEIAVHECPSCAPNYTDEQASAHAREFIHSTVSEVMDEAEKQRGRQRTH